MQKNKDRIFNTVLLVGAICLIALLLILGEMKPVEETGGVSDVLSSVQKEEKKIGATLLEGARSLEKEAASIVKGTSKQTGSTGAKGDASTPPAPAQPTATEQATTPAQPTAPKAPTTTTPKSDAVTKQKPHPIMRSTTEPDPSQAPKVPVAKTPVNEKPVAKTPVIEKPAETPVAKTPVIEKPAETPVAKTPVIEKQAEKPVAKTPVIEKPAEKPVTKTPVIEKPAEKPVAKTPVIEKQAETPVAKTPVIEKQAEKPVAKTPVIEEPAEKPVAKTPVIEEPAETPVSKKSAIVVEEELAWVEKQEPTEVDKAVESAAQKLASTEMKTVSRSPASNELIPGRFKVGDAGDDIYWLDSKNGKLYLLGLNARWLYCGQPILGAEQDTPVGTYTCFARPNSNQLTILNTATGAGWIVSFTIEGTHVTATNWQILGDPAESSDFLPTNAR